MKTKDSGPGSSGQSDGAVLCNVSWSPGTVDSEGGISALTNMLSHFNQCAHAAAGTGSSGCAVAKSADTLRDHFAIEVHARHDHDAALSPVVGGGKDTPMPKGEYRAISGFVDFFEVFAADRFPANRPAY